MSNETLKANTSEVHNSSGNQPASGRHTGGGHQQGEQHQKSGQQPGNPQHATPRHNDDPQKTERAGLSERQLRQARA